MPSGVRCNLKLHRVEVVTIKERRYGLSTVRQDILSVVMAVK
jgi:hypothetical protein